MSSLKARKPHIIKRRLTLLSIGLLSLTSCLQTTGALYVSHPQIHTRERLVEQRQREQQWIEKQLGEADRIQTTYQGLRDFREFVGFYNELAVSLNPAQGKLDQLTNDTRAAELNAQLWKQRTAELEAYRSYVAALKGDDQTTSKSPEATTNTKTENNTAQPPSLSTPYGTTPSGITLPNPNDLVKTKAEAHPLDLFYDRLAYRNAVNAALKSNQLDDSHDFAGQMLYELTLSVSLTPGDRSKQFAQVELEVQYDPLERRAPEIARLYDNWVAALRMNMVAEIGHLQRRLMEHKLTEYDRRYFRWFVESFGPALYVRLQGELTERSSSKTISEFPVLAFFDLLSKKNAEVLPTLKENLTTMTPDEVKLINSNYSFSAVDVKELKSLLDEINQIERSLPEKYLDQTLSEPLPEKQLVAFRKAVAWAVWGAHYIELNKIVGITAPQLDKGTGFLSGGLMVMERRAYDSEKKVDDRKELRDGKERESGEQTEDSWKSGLSKILSKLISRTPEPVEKRTTDSGVATFINRLYGIEKASYAATVQPKEHAQNISEVSARETMLNLVLALSAMLPNSGVNAGNKSQYVRRAQTYLHAITRQPLLVGYGNGEQRFGWFLGPAFRVEDGRADFVHRVTRHDVSAGIVVPAWWNYLHLRGKQLWIDTNGQSDPDKAVPLWGGQEIYLTIRPPERTTDHITQALLAHSITGDPYRHTSRPHPVIEDPTRKNVIRVQSVRPTEKGTQPQSVLVLGRDLWRNPQVFLGSIKADSVEVLSNMEGVLAKFDRVPYPATLTGPTPQQPVPVDLTVITSFGRDRCEGGVEILPPTGQATAEPEPATLSRPYVDDVEKALGFRLGRPTAYATIKLFLKPADDALSQFNVKDVQAKWTDDNKTVYFELGQGDTRRASRLWLADLRIYPRPDSESDAKSLTKKGGQEFAWFAGQFERGPTLAPNIIEYDAGGKAKSGFNLTFHKDRLKAVYMAYPGLSDAIAGSKAKVRLSLGNAHVVDVPLSALESPRPQKLLGSKEDLTLQSQKLLTDNIKGKDLEVTLVYDYTSDGKLVIIPVVASDGNPAKLKFTQEVKPSK